MRLNYLDVSHSEDGQPILHNKVQGLCPLWVLSCSTVAVLQVIDLLGLWESERAVPVTSDSTRVHVCVHRVVARGWSLRDQFLLVRIRIGLLLSVPSTRSPGFILSFFNHIMDVDLRAQRQIFQRADTVGESCSSQMMR